MTQLTLNKRKIEIFFILYLLPGIIITPLWNPNVRNAIDFFLPNVMREILLWPGTVIFEFLYIGASGLLVIIPILIILWVIYKLSYFLDWLFEYLPEKLTRNNTGKTNKNNS
jgi:hypothetical protein